jgi:hypothetical protein
MRLPYQIDHRLVQAHLIRGIATRDDNGIKYVELEFLTDWFLTNARKSESDSRKRRLLAASEALHAKHIKVGDFYNTACPMPRIIESFAALCKEAEDYGGDDRFRVHGFCYAR